MKKSNQERLKDYEEYMKIQNYPSSTIKSYLLGLRQFLAFKEKYNLDLTIDQEQARQFILFKYDNGAKWQTINNVYSALRKYFREVIHSEWTTKKIKRLRRERTLPILINKEEVQKIIDHCTMYKYQVFISLLYCTGMRLSECINLKLQHVDGQRKEILIKSGKGGKDRYINLPDSILGLLRSYYLREQPKVYLFNGKYKGKRLSTRSVQRGIKVGVHQAKISKQVSSHTFRHCYATHHLEAGTNIVYLQAQMGHKHLKTTARYIRLSKEYYQQIVHPIDTLEIAYMSNRRRSVNYLEIMESATSKPTGRGLIK